MPPEIARALELIAQLRDVLVEQRAGVDAERRLLRDRSYTALMEQARSRQERNARLARTLADLRLCIAGLTGEGDASAPIERSLARAPDVARYLAKPWRQASGLAGDLARADAINRALFERSLSVVQAFVTALRPSPAAYDRRGARAATAGRRTFSRRV